MKSPIFIFSLPRSGSTLLQRVLMSHKQIASVAEPWILLPFFYARKENGILTEYTHNTARNAIEDFIKNLPNRENDYNQALKQFILNLYEKQCVNGEMYFLDKTPRYHLIIPEIAELFPDAKFIFLFRNPIQILSSIIQTWGDGKLRYIYPYFVDFDFGIKNLSTGYLLLKNKSLAINYETFVNNPENTLKSICDYLDIKLNINMLNDFTLRNINGKAGDPSGIKNYNKIEASTLDKWKKTFSNTTRIRIAKNIIKKIDDDILKIQGYSQESIIATLEEVSYSKWPNIYDFFYWEINNLIVRFKLNLLLGKKFRRQYKKRLIS